MQCIAEGECLKNKRLRSEVLKLNQMTSAVATNVSKPQKRGKYLENKNNFIDSTVSELKAIYYKVS